jgi:hypothetical protein
MGMDIPAPGLNIRLQIGDAIDDGHDKSRSGLDVFSGLAWSCDPPNTHHQPSWPGLSRPSASLVSTSRKDVDARHKAGHDEVVG